MATPLDLFDIDIPDGMRSYLRAYGYNFNKKACEFAVARMKRMNPATGKLEHVDYMDKDAVEDLMKKHGIVIEHNDDAHLAKMIKDIIDDADNPGGNLFRKWLADADALGFVIDWDEII